MTKEPPGWVATDDTVPELRPDMTGRWRVITQGSTHIWDLDAMTYERHPGPTGRAGSFDHDGLPLPITRVDRWPRVGARSLVWFDDPDLPHLLEHYRICSTIKEIRRLVPNEAPGIEGAGSHS